ncbi:DNA polymerase III subunit chi [Roseateles toxinivorans]|uniref:DNA polymerase III chi subunit n=1 Tax=Roseateles toxinivorans TaxID=270368 RepID=A0A4R6QSR3_9BURK|nr:DNA polymerase III subunit chi [Roseateles toxinivorans]TDP74584.1 DNA polymerase III chi subunit [Roseateles toxinivorans]
MTEVSFYTGVSGRIDYACRLLRKAVLQGAKVTVCAPAPVLDRLDKALWTFEATEFVPHLRWGPDKGQALTPAMQATPVWLVEQADLAPHHDVLLNLGDELVPGFEAFDRVLEVVSTDAMDASGGRGRFKQYRSQGLNVKHHEVKA